MTKEQRDLIALAMVCGHAPDLQYKALTQAFPTYGAMTEAFGEVLALVNSCEDNAHKATQEIPVRVNIEVRQRGLNLPTLRGAFWGIDLAEGIDPAKTCEGCAFRLGTIANQSADTTASAKGCAEGWNGGFDCHMPRAHGKSGKRRLCAGHAQAVRTNEKVPS